MAEERLVLIDTDAGLDDTMAILMAIRAHREPKIPFRIIGITCVAGNTELDNVTVNVTRILEIMKATEIPIFRGAGVSMVIPFVHQDDNKFHGLDGFGDVLDMPKDNPKLDPENGISAIVRLAHEHAGKLSILALGPLTNLALAVRIDASISEKLQSIFLMGGNITGEGNITACAEFNFYVDPEAASVTLSTYKCPIIVLPLELGNARVAQTYDWRMEALGKFDTVPCKLLNKIEAKSLEKVWKSINSWRPYDSTAIAALIEPKVVTASANHHCTVELHGEYARGQLVVDYKSHLGEPANVTVVTEMDGNLFQRMLIWAVEGIENYDQ